MKGKMLMFSKISLKSFVYDIIDIFCFPDIEIREIYNRYQIIKAFIYLILTDTDSSSLQFTFISGITSSISEDVARNLIFEILLQKLGDRLDTSHEFFDKFSCRNQSTKKKVGLYEVESIDYSCKSCREYIEIFKSKDLNKKHKGIKKTTPGINFESFASRIMDVREYTYSYKKSKNNKINKVSIEKD